ncbi:MAG: hypothetical protein KGM98_11315, partial [Bacteroidota bacterium]|nr:hypothetical protein [Bacteroidota bacterium]
ISDLPNIVFMGTSIDSGYGQGVTIRIGGNTQFGKITQSVLYIKPETEFEKERMEQGIPLLGPVEEDLLALGNKWGLTLRKS